LSNGLLTENGAGLEQTEQVRTPQGGVSQEIPPQQMCTKTSSIPHDGFIGHYDGYPKCLGGPPLRGLRRECRQNGKTRCNFTTNNVDITVTQPNVGVQPTPVVLRRAVVKHRRYASSSQHQLCGKTLLKAQGAPW